MAKTPSKKTAPKKADPKAAPKSNHVDVTHESFLFGSSLDRMVDVLATAVKTEGREPKAVRAEFIVGRVASAIQRASLKSDKLTEELEARAMAYGICSKCAPDREPKAGQGKRTQGEHDMVRAADAWWSRVGRAAGVIKPKTMKPKTPGSTPSKTLPKTPVATPPKAVKTEAEAMTQVRNLLHTLAAFCAKNVKKLPPDVTSKCNGLSLEIDKLAASK